ncbi:MAG: thioredoxin [Nitrospirales bacterium]|nr:MAG: thioredoxin [Nitrospirales bacterium]
MLTPLFLNVGQIWASTDFETFQISREQAGTPMPPFELKTLKGTVVRSTSLKGRLVLLNFWATWCGPCKDEMPALGRLQEQLHDEDFQLLTITSDLQPEAIKAFLNILSVDFPVLLDETQDVSRTYMAQALPLSVLIGKDGRIIGRAMGPRAWDDLAMIAFMKLLLSQSAR